MYRPNLFQQSIVAVSRRFDGTRRHPLDIVRLARPNPLEIVWLALDCSACSSKSGPNSRAASHQPARLSGTLVTLLARTGTEVQTGLKSVVMRFQRIWNARLCVSFFCFQRWFYCYEGCANQTEFVVPHSSLQPKKAYKVKQIVWNRVFFKRCINHLIYHTTF